jgi:hypothetical protein
MHKSYFSVRGSTDCSHRGPPSLGQIGNWHYPCEAESAQTHGHST